MRHTITVLCTMMLMYALPGTVSAQTPQPAVTEAGNNAATRGATRACAECHDDSEAKVHVYHGDCLACHTDAENHAQAETPRKVKVAFPETAQCLACHVKDSRRMNFTFAEHNRAGIQCSDCHGMHSPKVKTLSVSMAKAGKEAALCATCHQDVQARFNMPSHHPVKEGGLSCIGCHDPHAGKQVTLASRTDQCLTCHQRIRGPQAFEHAPVAEDCATCHDPHGSPNRKLLQVAQPMLCLQCHSLPNVRHGQTALNTATTAAIVGERVSGAVLRNCTACHSQVHGSSHDEHLRY